MMAQFEIAVYGIFEPDSETIWMKKSRGRWRERVYFSRGKASAWLTGTLREDMTDALFARTRVMPMPLSEVGDADTVSEKVRERITRKLARRRQVAVRQEAA